MGFETLTPHKKDTRPFVKVRIVNEDNGKFLDVDNAIWDTGSTQTCISKDISDFLNLPLNGTGVAETANGNAKFSPTHCLFILPDKGEYELTKALVNLSIKQKDHVLIGQDIMKTGLTMVDVVKDNKEKLYTRLRFIPNIERK